MTFGWAQASRHVGEQEAAAMLRAFVDAGGEEVDTARMYAGGEGEGLLARAAALLPAEARQKLRVATKANPAAEAGDDGVGGLGAARLAGQLDASRAALRMGEGEPLDLFYLHWPDPATPLEPTLEQVRLRARVRVALTLTLTLSLTLTPTLTLTLSLTLTRSSAGRATCSLSPLYLPYISHVSPPYLACISRSSAGRATCS